MTQLRVDWELFSSGWIPDGVRGAVERYLAVLWQFLDCAHVREALGRNGPFRSEQFALTMEQWNFTYEIDLARGAAVVRDARSDA